MKASDHALDLSRDPVATTLAAVVVAAVTYLLEWVVLSMAGRVWLDDFAVMGPAGELDTFWLPAKSVPAMAVLFICTALAAARPSMRSLVAGTALVVTLALYGFGWTDHAADRVRAGHEVERSFIVPLPVTARRVQLGGASAQALPRLASRRPLLEIARGDGLVYIYDKTGGVTVGVSRADILPDG